MDRYPKRLIEVDLPIKRISAHARREKSIRHGHISTLHIWWARRPLAACRAVICAALWPDPADELCPIAFREAAFCIMKDFAREAMSNRTVRDGLLSEYTLGHVMAVNQMSADFGPGNPNAHSVLKQVLLDFIADFANWDASTNPLFLKTARALTKAGHEALGGEPGTRPIVVDPFAGGGAIPFEVLRVGGDAVASDLNPVAFLINKTILEDIPRFGDDLASEVERLGKDIEAKANNTLSKFYPSDSDGSIPIAYLWARTIRCDGPGCGIEIPLVSSPWVARKGKKSVGLLFKPLSNSKGIKIEVVYNAKENDISQATVKRGAAVCPCCGYTTPVTRVREQLARLKGGADDARLLCVVITHSGEKGRYYREPLEKDYEAIVAAKEELKRKIRNHVGKYSLLPDEPLPPVGTLGYRIQKYGMTQWCNLFTSRQALALSTISDLCRSVQENLDDQRGETIATLLSFALSRTQDLNASTSSWANTIEAVCGANRAQNRMPMVWDFVEAVPLGDSGGNWLGQVRWITEVIKHIAASTTNTGTTLQAPAQNKVLPTNSVDALFTDPPYYDAFGYSDLSDYFLAWLKRSLPEKTVSRFNLSETAMAPKSMEIVVNPGAESDGRGTKDRKWFEEQLEIALLQAEDIVKSDGIGIVVFANKSTSGWDALIKAILGSGWTVTASWPIDTERPNRQRAQGSAALGSSVHLVLRPREGSRSMVNSGNIGDWRDVLSELPQRIHEWMPRLAQEGVVGADAIFACLGPALEIFSRYSSVERTSGEKVELKEYLEHVWAAVAREALNMIFQGADASGFEEDARLTAMWLWTLRTPDANGHAVEAEESAESEEDNAKSTVGRYSLEYDAARKIAQGLGAHLEALGHLVEIKGETANLLPAGVRTRYLFGKQATQPSRPRRRNAERQLTFDFARELEVVEEEAGILTGNLSVSPGATVLDQLHQSMILFGAGRGEALKRFLVDESIGRNPLFWRLAQALSALYPASSEEKRWVDGVMARKKGLGL